MSYLHPTNCFFTWSDHPPTQQPATTGFSPQLHTSWLAFPAPWTPPGLSLDSPVHLFPSSPPQLQHLCNKGPCVLPSLSPVSVFASWVQSSEHNTVLHGGGISQEKKCRSRLCFTFINIARQSICAAFMWRTTKCVPA